MRLVHQLSYRVACAFATVFIVLPSVSMSDSLVESDLPGVWRPSGEFKREQSVRDYELHVDSDLDAEYVSLGGVKKKDVLKLGCSYKPSDSQDSVFVYYCYLNDLHVITLSLAGWKSESGQLLFGHEYWLGSPEPGDIHGGLPVSLEKVR